MTVLAFALLLTACNGNDNKTPGPEPTATPVVTPAPSGCEVHVLSVGKADAILIIADGQTMLIDAGYRTAAETILTYLRGHGVTKLDYVLLTHGDRDHVGGMGDVLNGVEVGQMLLCPRKEKNLDLYTYMMQVLTNKSIPYSVPDVGAKYTLGKGTFTVIAPGPEALAKDSDNDASVAIRYEYGDRSFLLMGDALDTTEKELLKTSFTIRADVLKTGHHGKSDATCKKFLRAVQPAYAVISCGANEYGEMEGPAQKVLDLLSDFHVETLRTDQLGTIVFRTDGKDLSYDTEVNNGQ